MSERWRVFVWRLARCEPHSPDKQLNGHIWHSILPVLCYTLLVISHVKSVSKIPHCLDFFALEISRLYSARMTGMLLYVLCRVVCFLPFSHLPSLAQLYPTPPVDVFFTDDLLWISNLQCSDCYRQQQCFSRAVKAKLPPPLSASVTPPYHALVSL